jgi:hypothetical protein
MLLTAVTDRYYADGGHALDFVNKAFEALDLIGWQHADLVLPAIVPVLTGSRGREEADSWRHPVDLVELTEAALHELPGAIAAGLPKRGGWRDFAALGHAILGDDPAAVLKALLAALNGGAAPADAARAVAYSAALRVAHFSTTNEHSDWDSAHHAFSYCNAAFRLVVRSTGSGADQEDEVGALRAVMHGALAVYLNRYLNVPPARLPGEEELSGLPRTAAELRNVFLDTCDRQQQVATAARLAARHLWLGLPAADLQATLGRALLREDAGFHMVQNFEAAVRLSLAWQGQPGSTEILVAAARFLAAHAPTTRRRYQAADIARRLMAGNAVHEGAE